MSRAFYQNITNQVSSIVDKEFGIIDEVGMIVSSTNGERIGEMVDFIRKFVISDESFLVARGMSFQKEFIKNKMECIAYFGSVESTSLKYLSLIALNIVNTKLNYDEKHDKMSLIKSILLDNILSGEILVRAKELHLTNNVFRCVFLIKTEKPHDIFVHEVVQKLFPNKLKDFIIVLDDEHTALVKELKSENDIDEVIKTAENIVNIITAELMLKTVIGIGSSVESIKDISKSYKESQVALLVGSIFEREKFIIHYNKLGIGRLIYQLPTTLCNLFLKEVFKDGAFEALDSETILTIQKFFENNLNISETSRQLYVHRNTLVYRLEKIQKITNLDLRNFEDAIIFKVAMLVKKYLENG